MSLDIKVDVRGLIPADVALAKLAPLDHAKLLLSLARLIQQQTRRRIEDEKTSPDGAAWKPNRTGTPTLYQTGALARSIDYLVQGMQVVVGAPSEPVQGKPYAAIHQFGGTIVPKSADALAFVIGGQLVRTKKVTIPARPYLGVSSANAREITDAAARFIRKVLGL